MTTKKLLQSMTKDGKATLRGELLLPCLESPRLNCFVGLKSGKKYSKGYVVYLGEEVSCEEILAKVEITEDSKTDVRVILESYIQELSAFKIGNVISITFPESVRCILKKEGDAPASDHKKKLP